MRVTLFNPTGSGITHFTVGSVAGTVALGTVAIVACAENAEVTTDLEFTWFHATSKRITVQACSDAAGTPAALATDKLFYLKAFSAFPLGLVLSPEANAPGNGYVLNSAPGVLGGPIVLPSAGVSFALPDNKVNRIWGTTSTSGNQQLLGATYLLPAWSQLLRVRAFVRSGTPTITIGTTSAGSQLVASTTLVTSGQALNIALPGGIISGASPIWIGSNSPNLVTTDFAWEPLGFSP